MPAGVLAEGPHPGTVTVELMVRPLAGRVEAFQGETAVRVLGGVDRLATATALDQFLDHGAPRQQDARAPVEERLGARNLTRATRGVGDERAVP